MDKALNYLALARKGGLCELGEEPVGAVSRTGRAYVVLVAGDASDHTWRRAKSFVSGSEQQCIRLEATKDQMGLAVGRQSLAIAAVTDVQLALALVKALEKPERYKDALEILEAKAQKAKKRQAEARAHQKNVRKGKKQ
ncbi:MAG: 50S ribosomal protein L7 [Eubacteriales bacterium]|nr:50S ribosomal protein L7 [Eubacteriales bacterium]